MEERIEILYGATEKQNQFMEKVFSGDYTYLLFGGGIRSGKSYCLFACLLLLCKMYPGSRWAIVRADMSRITDAILPSLKNIIPNSFLKSYNANTNVFRMTNGSEIILFAESYYEDKLLLRWRGLEVNGFAADEVNELQEATFNAMIQRAGSYIIPRLEKQPQPLILMTCNPSKGWVKTLFYDRSKTNSLPAKWYYLPANINDNPYMKSEYLESLKSMTTFDYEVMVNGNWELQMKTGGEIYRSFEINKHVQKCEYDPTLPLRISFDDNCVPYLPCTVYQIKGLEIFQIGEIIGRYPDNHVRAVCDLFSRKYYNHKAGLFVYGDATAKKSDTKMESGHNFYSLILGYLKKFSPQSRVLKSNPSTAMRVSFINAVFEKEVFGMRFRIDPICKESITDFIMVKEAEDGTKNKTVTTDSLTHVRSQPYGHTSDSFDYFICSAFAEKFSMYQNGGRNSIPVTYGRNGLSRNHIGFVDNGSSYQKRVSKNSYR